MADNNFRIRVVRRRIRKPSAQEFRILKLLASPDLNRNQWRAICVEQIVEKQCRLDDIVKYRIKFSDCKEPIWVDRKNLLRLRPRGYLRKLEEHDKSEQFSVDKVCGRILKEGTPYYYIKFFKHPESDNSWVKVTDIENYRYLENLHSSGGLLDKILHNKAIVKANPNDKLVARLSSNIEVIEIE